MGILNVTPDSFSDGGQHHAVDDAIDGAEDAIDELLPDKPDSSVSPSVKPDETANPSGSGAPSATKSP